MQQHPPGSALPRAHFTRGKNRGLRKFAVSGKLSVAKQVSFRATGLCRPAASAGFAISGFQCRGPRGRRDAYAPDCTHLSSLPDYCQPINRAGYVLARKDGTRLDDMAGKKVSLGIRTIQELSWRVGPLYAARVQDLEPGDVAVFKCGACGHTAELPPSALTRRTDCSRSVSDFRRSTKRKTEVGIIPRATYARVCDRPRVAAPAALLDAVAPADVMQPAHTIYGS